MKLKYRLNNKVILLIIFAIFILFSTLDASRAGTIASDNINYSTNKTLKISDDLNLAYINEYNYEVFVNGSHIGTYKKGEIIYIPDGGNITVYVPADIKTNFNDAWNTGKIFTAIILLLLVVFGTGIFLVVFFIKKINKRRR